MKNPKFHSVTDPEPLEDLIPGLAPKNHITILSGDSYIGKTRLALRMAEAFSKGMGFFWEPLPPMRVGYFSERSASSVVRQLNDQGIDLEYVTFVTLLDLPIEESNEYMAKSLTWLNSILTEHKFDVIFLDTFGHFLPAYARSKGAMNDYGLMTKATIELQRLCMNHKVSPICLYHNAKEKVGSEFKTFKAKVSGSAAISANTLALWSFSEYSGAISKEDLEESVQYRQLEIAYHHAADQILYFRTLPNGSFIKIPKIEADTPQEQRSTKTDEVLSLVPEDGIARATLIEKLQTEAGLTKGYAKTLVSRALSSNKLFIEHIDREEFVKRRLLTPVKSEKTV